jgi:hypothetical protein
MNPELIEALLQLHNRNLKFGSPLLQMAFERLVPRVAESTHQTPGATPASDFRASPSLLDALRSQQLIVEELVRIHGLLMLLVAGSWPRSATTPQASRDQPGNDSVPRPSQDEVEIEPAADSAPEAKHAEPAAEGAPDLHEMLKQAERLLLLHPMAAQAAFSALVAQGRRFATTPHGQNMASALSSSPILAKLRRIWETTTLNMLEERPTTVLPNMYIEAIFRAAKSANLEELLSAQHPTGKAR